MVKWKLYAIAAEEMMSYLDKDERSAIVNKIACVQNTHAPQALSRGLFSGRKRPQCIICSMEEATKNRVLDEPHRNNRSRARRAKHLVKCFDPNCHVIAHMCTFQSSRLHCAPHFFDLTCFEVAHHPLTKRLFTQVERKGKVYCQMVPIHPVVIDLICSRFVVS